VHCLELQDGVNGIMLTEITSLNVDFSLVDEAYYLKVVWGLNELDTCQGTLGHETGAVWTVSE
jgi:hypothetical protein